MRVAWRDFRTVVALSLTFFLLACPNGDGTEPVTEGEMEGDTVRPPIRGELAITDLQVKLDAGEPSTEPQACTQPKPDNLGCTTVCKPCITWICVDGEWQREPIEWDDGLCSPPDPEEPGPFACPRDETGFCPAECSVCF